MTLSTSRQLCFEWISMENESILLSSIFQLLSFTQFFLYLLSAACHVRLISNLLNVGDITSLQVWDEIKNFICTPTYLYENEGLHKMKATTSITEITLNVYFPFLPPAVGLVSVIN